MTEGSDGGLIYHYAPFNEAQSLSQNRDTARAMASFYLSPDPLPLALPYLRALYNPPPPGGGMSERGDRFAWRARIWLAVIASVRPVSLTHRSFDYSKSACGSSALFRQAHRLSDTERRGGLDGIIPQSAFPIFQRLAALRPLSPLIRYGRRDDDILVVSIYGRYRWRAEAFHIRVSFISIRSRSRSPTPFRPASSLIRYEKRDEGLLSSLVPLFSLVAVVDGIADGDSVPVDGV